MTCSGPVREADRRAHRDAALHPLKIPDVLPHFELADRDGKKRIAQGLGRPAADGELLGHLVRALPPRNPPAQRICGKAAAQRLEIVGIAVDFREDVLKYAEETIPISYPLLIGEEDGLEAVKAVGMQPAFPFTVFADSKQRIVALKVGELHQDEADLILDKLMAVDAGKLDLQGRAQEITEGLKEIATRRAPAEGGEAQIRLRSLPDRRKWRQVDRF